MLHMNIEDDLNIEITQFTDEILNDFNNRIVNPQNIK